MAQFQIFKVTALPGTLVPNGIYIVTTNEAAHVELHVADNSGTVTRRLYNKTDIQALIDASLADIGKLEVQPDIASRDALILTKNTQVLVVDASADPTVDSGAATYVWNTSNSTWTKISEAESLDLSIQWAEILNKPISSVGDIDDAVVKKHAHSNATQLDKIGENVDGNFTYDGENYVVSGSIDW